MDLPSLGFLGVGSLPDVLQEVIKNKAPISREKAVLIFILFKLLN